MKRNQVLPHTIESGGGDDDSGVGQRKEFLDA